MQIILLTCCLTLTASQAIPAEAAAMAATTTAAKTTAQPRKGASHAGDTTTDEQAPRTAQANAPAQGETATGRASTTAQPLPPDATQSDPGTMPDAAPETAQQEAARPASLAGGADLSGLMPLSRLSKEEIQKQPYTSFLLNRLIREDKGRVPARFHKSLFPPLITMAKQIGHKEDPRTGVLRAIHCFTDQLGFHVHPGEPTFEAVMPDQVVKHRRGTPNLLTLIFLAMMERYNVPGETKARFPLTPIMVNGSLLLRYEFNDYAFNVSFDKGPRLLNDRETRECYLPAGRHPEPYFHPLNRVETAAIMLGETARAHGTSGNMIKQRQYLQKAVALFPGSNSLRLRLSRVLIRNGDLNEATGLLSMILRNAPENGEAHFLLGVARMEQKLFPGAKTAFEAALRHDFLEDGKIWLYLAYLGFQASPTHEPMQQYMAKFLAESGRQDLQAQTDLVLRQIQIRQAAATLNGKAPYTEKFNCVHLLKAHPSQLGFETLIAKLNDSNTQFRIYVWKTLKDMSGLDLPLSTHAWWQWHARQPREDTGTLWQQLDLLQSRRKPSAAPNPLAER